MCADAAVGADAATCGGAVSRDDAVGWRRWRCRPGRDAGPHCAPRRRRASRTGPQGAIPSGTRRGPAGSR